MVDEKKIQEVKKKIRETMKEQSMELDNEPGHSGDPINTIQKDVEEKEEENESRNRQ
jgi:RNA binding exosome subunit